jgi:NAD(P)-dependent dehydrogenase (short-subunit alcohol dehydrogenase family)
MHVIITDKYLTSLTNTENIIISNGGTCTVVELDMKDFLGIDRLGLEIFKRWGKLDILIANAAILGTLSLFSITRVTKSFQMFEHKFNK